MTKMRTKTKWSYNKAGLAGLYLNGCSSFFIWRWLRLGHRSIFKSVDCEGIQEIDKSEVEIA
ncbi:MAG TPA: hypothetical protein DEF89_02000 [Desulfosporosinus sp.]|nr:MAG: hypothetical protein JL57_20355 [Desulfosporosinus sp. BICA1-9]HBW34198.1 hypothetical protein [Desulfosporosinus sp.]